MDFEIILLLSNILFFAGVNHTQKSFFEKCLMVVKSGDLVDYQNYLNTSVEPSSTKKEEKNNLVPLTSANFYDLIDSKQK